MESHQVCSLLDKLHKDIKEDIRNIFDKGGDPRCNLKIEEKKQKVYSIEFSYADRNEFQEINVKYDDDSLVIEMKTTSGCIGGWYNIKYHLFSKVWWSWKRLSSLLNKNIKRIRNKEHQIKKNQYAAKFNDVYATVFPEEIDKILLGDKGDK